MVCVSLCTIGKCSLYIIILRWFVKRYLLTFGFELLSWYRHNLWHNAWNRFHQQLLGKTDMNSIQSWWNKTARFRFSIKYLKLKVVLQIVCLVPALLAPKLIFYISTNELLFTNFKDAAFSSHPLIQCCFAMIQCFENWGVVCQIKRSQTIIRQLPYQSIKSTQPDDWVQQQ